jgi:taurine dioxygenase
MTLSAETMSARRGITGTLDVVPTGAALGAEVRGIDLRNIEEGAFGDLMHAWHQHSVLLIRSQSLNDQELISFSRRFGDLDWAPIQENGRRFVEGLPEIYIVSNVKVNGEAIGSLGDGEAVWHTDMSYLEVPPKASMLYSLEVPPTGGNTSFCSMYAIYGALPGKLKERIPNLKIKHDGTYNSGGYVRQGITATDDPLTSPGAVHPLVRTPEHWPADALSRPPPQRLSGWPATRGIRGPARRVVGIRRPAGIHLGARLARRRSCHVGQSLHHASA